MFNSKSCRCEHCSPTSILRKSQECQQDWKNRFCSLRKQWSEHSKCGSNNLEDCADCRSSNVEKVVGKFGIAWVAEIPNCESEEPKGWQIEIEDTPEGIFKKCRKLIQWLNDPPKIYDRIEGNNTFSSLGYNKKCSFKDCEEKKLRINNYNNFDNDSVEDFCADKMSPCEFEDRRCSLNDESERNNFWEEDSFRKRCPSKVRQCRNCSNKISKEHDTISHKCNLGENCQENVENILRNRRNDRHPSNICKNAINNRKNGRESEERFRNCCDEFETKFVDNDRRFKKNNCIVNNNSRTCIDYNYCFNGKENEINSNECKYRKNNQKSTDEESTCNEECYHPNLKSCFPKRPNKCQFTSRLPPEDGDTFRRENCCCHCQNKFFKNTGTMCDSDSIPRRENDINELDSKVICAGIRTEAMCKKMMEKKRNQMIEEQEREIKNTIIATELTNVKEENEDNNTNNNNLLTTDSLIPLMNYSNNSQRRSSKFRRKESM